MDELKEHSFWVWNSTGMTKLESCIKTRIAFKKKDRFIKIEEVEELLAFSKKRG